MKLQLLLSCTLIALAMCLVIGERVSTHSLSSHGHVQDKRVGDFFRSIFGGKKSKKDPTPSVTSTKSKSKGSGSGSGNQPIETGGEGDCLFYSLQYLESGEKRSRAHRTLRADVVRWVTENCDQLLQSDRAKLSMNVALEDLGSRKPSTNSGMCEAWAKKMRSQGVMGDDIAIEAAAHVLGHTIKVYRSAGHGAYDLVREAQGGGSTYHILNINNFHFQAFDGEPTVTERGAEREAEHEVAQDRTDRALAECKQYLTTLNEAIPCIHFDQVNSLTKPTFVDTYGSSCHEVERALCPLD